MLVMPICVVQNGTFHWLLLLPLQSTPFAKTAKAGSPCTFFKLLMGVFTWNERDRSLVEARVRDPCSKYEMPLT